MPQSHAEPSKPSNQALRSRDIPTQLVVYPDEGHQLTVPSYLRDRLARNLAWYDLYLKDSPR